MQNQMVYKTNERPKTGKWFVLSFQHVFAMFGATILVPSLTGMPHSVALLTAGVGTLIYILVTKAKVPIFLGSSFSYIVVIQTVSGFVKATDDTAAVPGNYSAVLTGLFFVGLTYVIMALIIKKIGTGWLDKLLPPVVIGPMIVVIGFGLAPTAIMNSGIVKGGDWRNMIVALASFLTVILIALKAKGFLKIIPFLIGIVVGYVVALILGVVNFTNLQTIISNPSSWFKLPDFMFLWFSDGSAQVGSSTITFYQINFAAILTILPLALVTASEHIGDHAVLSEIVGEDFLKDPGLDKTMMGSGLATMFASLVGGPANTTYGENTSVVGMTKVASVWVTGLAAVIVIFLSFFNLFVAVIESIPEAVMGGMSLILFGFIGLNGIKVIIDKKVNLHSTRNMIIVSSMLVLGLGGAIIEAGQTEITSLTIAAVVGILLNLLLPKDKEEIDNK